MYTQAEGLTKIRGNESSRQAAESGLGSQTQSSHYKLEEAKKKMGY